MLDFPGGTVDRKLLSNTGDLKMTLVPGPGTSLVPEDATCHGATKPVHHNHLEPTYFNY